MLHLAAGSDLVPDQMLVRRGNPRDACDCAPVTVETMRPGDGAILRHDRADRPV